MVSTSRHIPEELKWLKLVVTYLKTLND